VVQGRKHALNYSLLALYIAIVIYPRITLLIYVIYLYKIKFYIFLRSKIKFYVRVFFYRKLLIVE
jgi:hypothetical protein